MNHMNSRTVIGLGVAAAVALIAAFAINSSRKPHVEGAQAVSYALPELTDHLNDVKSLGLSGPGSQPIATLEKGDKGWTLKEKGGYRADAGKVREYLLKLSQARLIEQKTANEQRYADLGVSDIGAADAKGVLVALDGLGKPAQLIVGTVSPRGDGTFVRRAGDKQSWLAKGNIAPDKNAVYWLDASITDIPATRVREFSLHKPDAKPLRGYKAQAADTNYSVADLPKGRELSSEFAANTLGTTLAGLNFEDVFPAAQNPPPADKLFRARYTTFDGVVVEVTAWKKDETKFYAQFRADKDAAAAEAAVVEAQAKAKADYEAQQAAQPADAKDAKPATPPAAVSDPAKDKADRLAAVDSEVAALAQRFDGWTFALPQHKFANLDKTVDELLKPLEQKPAATKK